MNIFHQIATELQVQEQQVQAAVKLLDAGNTVPFIARYRKEVTQGLTDTELRTLDTRLAYLRELEERRRVILKSIAEQGQLTDELTQAIASCENKTKLEDLYQPFKPKRRTKGQIAIEAGLTELAQSLWDNPHQDPQQQAAHFINAEAGFATNKAVLDGARAILIERFAEDAQLIDKIRRHLIQSAQLESRLVAGMEQQGAKFKDYFEHNELLSKVPSHRALAMLRGRNEGILQLSLNADPDQQAGSTGSYCETIIIQHYNIALGDACADSWRKQVVSYTWKTKIALHLETELMAALKEQADAQAIGVFALNLKDLLMTAPAGARCTLGIDPGLRTGCKVAVVDGTGKLLDHTTIYPTAPHHKIDQASQILLALIKRYQVNLIAIGNGTASRETEQFVHSMLKKAQQPVQTVMVSEAGASVYSASELAAKEFPTLDVSLRGAVSIARRLQDPLAELVKIEPKSIGVGQYQHDVNQNLLAKRLDSVIEDCVNAVGVDLNSASVPLLTRVAGLSATMASNIVAYRDEHGRFDERKTLLKVPRLGAKAYEQCAGFLRVTAGKNPLDGSAVHPEAYPLVQRIAKNLNTQLSSMIGNQGLLAQITAADYATEQFGELTIKDILNELAKPGRDPRPEFKTASFAKDINEVKDLKPGMQLEGVVTNITNFGAFVDVGVHQDGLVHISAISNKFISDPREVVKTGDIVKVKVIEVDVARKRIALSMRLTDEASPAQPTAATPTVAKKATKVNPNSAFADAFARAKKQ